MRILVVNNNFFLRGGAERAFFDMINILEKKGHKVAHFSSKTKEDRQSPWEKYFVKYNELSDSSKFGTFEKMKIVSRIWYNFETRRKLRELIKEFQPEVAHLHNIFHHLSPSVIDELKKQGVPIVWTLHDYKMVSPSYDLSVRGNIWEENKKGRMHKCITHKCVYDSYLKSTVCVIENFLHRFLKTFNKVDQFISPSNFLIDKYGEFGFKAQIEKIVNPVLPRKVNFDLEPWKLGIGEHREGFMLYVGRLSFGKGVQDLIEAYAGLDTRTSLLIAGDGPEREGLGLLAKKLNVCGKVKFLGKLEDDKLFPIMARADFVVMPSRLYENAPYGILEAMLLGKPVISSNLGGSREIIKNSGAGDLFEAGDVDDLKVKLQYAVENKEFFKEKGSQGRKFIEEHYSEDLFYDKLMTIYRALISKKA